MTPLSTFALIPLITDLRKYTLTLSDLYHYPKATLILLQFTRWPEAIPIPDITAPKVARAFVSGWISRFGVLSTVTMDCGCQFESTLWKELVEL